MSASTLIKAFGRVLTIRRYSAGAWSDGHWTRGAEKFLTPANQVQVITFDAVPDAGTLVLVLGEEEAEAVAVPGDLTTVENLETFEASLQAAFEALPSVDVGNAVLSLAISSGLLELTITFGGELAETPMAEVVADSAMTDEGTVVSVGTSDVTVPGVAPETRLTATISFQVVGGREIDLLPEGERTKESRKGYTTTLLRTTDEQNATAADEIEADGRLWKVVRVDAFPSETDLPHYRILTVLVEDDNEEE